MFKSSLLLAAILIAIALPCSAARQDGKKVLAFYTSGYATPATSGEYAMWNDGRHDPGKPLLDGMPDIASAQHPLALYDSADPVILRKHLKLAQGMGIDGFVVGWSAKGDPLDKGFQILLKEAEKTPVKLSLQLDAIPVDVDGKTSVDAIAASLDYIIGRYAKSPAFFRYGDLPVVFLKNRALNGITAPQWVEVVKKVRAKHKVQLMGNSTDAGWLKILDGLYDYYPARAGTSAATISKAYAETIALCRKKSKIATATVFPGYDDSRSGAMSPVAVGREDGDLYRRAWRSAGNAGADIILISSFNQWGEGTEIEPSRESGSLYADLTRLYAGFYKKAQQGIVTVSGLNVSAVKPVMIKTGKLRPGCFLLENLDGESALVAVESAQLKAAVAFELGKGDRRLRPATLKKLTPTQYQIRLAAGSRYELWSKPDFLRYAAASLDKSTLTAAGIGSAAPTARQILKAYALISKEPGKAAARLLLADAETAALALGTTFTGESEGSGPSEFKVVNGRPFVLTAMVRNQGPAVLKDGTVQRTVPDDWRIESKDQKLFEQLLPGRSAKATFTMSSGNRTPTGIAIPAIAWISYSVDGVRVETQNNCTLISTSPFELVPVITKADPVAPVLKLIVRSDFPELELKDVRASVELPKGWTADGEGITPSTVVDGQYDKIVNVTGQADVIFNLRRPNDDKDGLKLLRAKGYLGANMTAKWYAIEGVCELKEKNTNNGVQMVQTELSRTEPANVGGSDCRRILDGNDGNGYCYFDVDDRFSAAGDTYVSVDYFDDGVGGFRIDYDSKEPGFSLESSAYKKTYMTGMSGGDCWKSFTFTISGAAVSGREAGGADLRIVSQKPGGLAVRRVKVSKLPSR